MTSLLAGIDLSTKRLDAALIPLDPDHGDPNCPPVVFRHVLLPNEKGATPLYRRVERARAMRRLVHELLKPVPYTLPAPHQIATHDVASAWLENPRGRHRNDALTGTFDAIAAAIPSHIIVAGLDPQEWRRELGLPARMPKASAQIWTRDWLSDQGVVHRGAHPPDEHLAEALLVALAGRQILQRHQSA